MKARNMLFACLMSIAVCSLGCKKRDKNTQPMGVEGSWKIVSVVNASGATPSNLQSMVNGTAIFQSNTYEFKDNSGQSKETGSYNYDASNAKLNVSPNTASVFTNQNSAYVFDAQLASPNLSLRVNVAPAGKPANEISIGLVKN